MSLQAKRWSAILIAIAVLGTSVFVLMRRSSHSSSADRAHHPLRLYWFVPDGLRADPDIFTIYKWAAEGKLPNIKRMMEQGSYGYSIPVFPSHTPVNFATLFTGTKPDRHGVADGPLRLRGYPLNIVARSGFSSLAKTIDPFWYTLEQAGKIVSLLSIPGSTPPEINDGHVVKGRWGGWGMDFPNIIFHSHADLNFRQQIGWNDKVFQIEKKLTEFIKASPPKDWPEGQVSYSPARELNLRNWGSDLFVLLLDQTDDHQENYDTALLSLDKRQILATLHVGGWSEWFPLTLSYKVQRNYQENLPQKLQIEQNLSALHFDSQARVKIIQLGKKDMFRIRVLYDGLNESVVLPASLDKELHQAAGPMVDFVDNFPPQLIYFPEDKQAFVDEFEMSFKWHKSAEKYFLEQVPQDVFVQSIYSPNQMLTSRWWMGFVDPRGRNYKKINEDERAQTWAEVLRMYQHIDEMLGMALDRREKDAYVILSSDHGAVPLNYEVRLNNFFAKKGWLFSKPDPETGVPRIDWAKTKVVFVNMNHIYIKPQGLAGNYQPASGPAYQKLRQEVSKALQQLKDSQGNSPLAAIHTREEASQWGLPGQRVGDLLIANKAGYGWIEDVTKDRQVFAEALKSGYKQAILPDQEKGLWTPFMVVGPGVKRGHALSRPISHLEQYPTIMRLLKVPMSYTPDAEPLAEILQ